MNSCASWNLCEPPLQTQTAHAHIFSDTYSALHSLKLGSDNCLRTYTGKRTHEAIVTIETKSTNNNMYIAMATIQCHQNGAYSGAVSFRHEFVYVLFYWFEWVSFTDVLTHSMFPFKFQHLHWCCFASHIIIIFNAIVIINCTMCTLHSVVQAFTRLNGT